MSSSDNKESLFGINFDIDTPINIEVKYQNSRTAIKPGHQYPMLCKGMARKYFSSWNLTHLQEFLAACGINKTGNKYNVVMDPRY